MAKGTTTAELREKSSEDLAAFISETEKSLLNARFDNHANRLNDTSRIGKLRRELARALTVRSEKSAKG